LHVGFVPLDGDIIRIPDYGGRAKRAAILSGDKGETPLMALASCLKAEARQY
jgi:hypothetical protein